MTIKTEQVEGTTGVLTDDGTVIYYDEEEDVSIGVQPLSEKMGNEDIDSVRILINILNSHAQHEYSFDLNLEPDESLVTARDYLGKDYDTGEAYVIDSEGFIKTVIDPAWAKDANGAPVDTHYEVSGNTLIQIVEFNENTAFPVVADPTAWQIAKCAGAISWIVGSTVFGAAKILKIKKYIKALGGVKKSASKLIGIIKKAKKIAKKHKTNVRKVLRQTKYKKELYDGVGKTLMNFGAEVLGVDAVVDNCNF